MEKARHSFLMTLAAAALLILIALVVQTHSPVPLRDTATNLGSPLSFSPDIPPPHFNTTYSDSSYNTPPSPQETPPPTPVTPDTPLDIPYSEPEVAVAPQETVSKIVSSDSKFDFDAFMKKLSGSAPAAQSLPPSVFTQQYAVVPEHLFTTAPSTQAPAQTSAQQELYTYGNTAGTLIKKYDDLHPNDYTVVQNYFDNRSNAAQAIALRQLGDDLRAIGVGMHSMSNIPSPAIAAHSALADSYIDIGQKLAAIPDAKANADIVAAINTYDDAIDVYAKNYTNIVLMFSQNNIIFQSDDPGSVFMFSKMNN